MAARSFLGAGDVYIERFVAGVSQGMAGPYFADKFEIKPNLDKKESTSKGRYSYGQVLETVNIQKPADFTLDLKEVNKESLTLALLGTQAVTSQAAGALTAVTFVAKLDQWVDTGKTLLGPTILLTNTGATVTYVENVDYIANRSLGWIKAITGGAIVDAASLKLTGTFLAYSGIKISGATNSDIRARVFFDGVNQADGLPVRVNVREAVIATDSAFDFLANDFANISLKGTMKTPTGQTEPFTVELVTPA